MYGMFLRGMRQVKAHFSQINPSGIALSGLVSLEKQYMHILTKFIQDLMNEIEHIPAEISNAPSHTEYHIRNTHTQHSRGVPSDNINALRVFQLLLSDWLVAKGVYEW